VDQKSEKMAKTLWKMQGICNFLVISPFCPITLQCFDLLNLSKRKQNIAEPFLDRTTKQLKDSRCGRHFMYMEKKRLK
jgi:hypothetical protein